MLEALSLSADPPAPPGRFTELLQPAGFEALVGVTPVARPHPGSPQQHRETTAPPRHAGTNRPQPASKKKTASRDRCSRRAPPGRGGRSCSRSRSRCRKEGGRSCAYRQRVANWNTRSPRRIAHGRRRTLRASSCARAEDALAARPRGDGAGSDASSRQRKPRCRDSERCVWAEGGPEAGS